MYVERVLADGNEKAKMSLAAEKVRSRRYEMLYLKEPLDEIIHDRVRD